MTKPNQMYIYVLTIEVHNQVSSVKYHFLNIAMLNKSCFDSALAISLLLLSWALIHIPLFLGEVFGGSLSHYFDNSLNTLGVAQLGEW